MQIFNIDVVYEINGDTYNILVESVDITDSREYSLEFSRGRTRGVPIPTYTGGNTPDEVTLNMTQYSTALQNAIEAQQKAILFGGDDSERYGKLTITSIFDANNKWVLDTAVDSGSAKQSNIDDSADSDFAITLRGNLIESGKGSVA